MLLFCALRCEVTMALGDITNTLAASQGDKLTPDEERKRLNMMLFLGQMLQNGKIYRHAAGHGNRCRQKKSFLSI